jgi:hypothetical protein
MIRDRSREKSFDKNNKNLNGKLHIGNLSFNVQE